MVLLISLLLLFLTLNPPVVGDLYINTTAGTVNAGFAGAAGAATDVGDRMLWDGTEWDLVTSSQDVGVD